MLKHSITECLLYPSKYLDLTFEKIDHSVRVAVSGQDNNCVTVKVYLLPFHFH